jgi:hypothetical protein
VIYCSRFIDVADIEETAEGVRVMIRRAKTDQEGLGRTLAIVRGDVACPVKALAAWLDAAGIESGPLFPPHQQGRHSQSQQALGSICRQYRQGVCRARWFRCQRIFGAFATRGLPHVCGRQRRINLQNDGRERAPFR